MATKIDIFFFLQRTDFLPVLGGARQKTNKKRKILGRKTKNIFYKVKDVPKFSGERKKFFKKIKKS